MKEDERFGETVKGQPKFERYGWTVLDEMGSVRLIDKKTLKIDPSYQRSLQRDGAVLRLASNWSWVACGAIVVAERDQQFYVIDGQTRVAAALKRSDISKIPVVVFRSTEAKDEALGFLRINTERRNVKMIEKIKAMVLAGDPLAHRIYEMAEDSGREISNKSGGKSIKCINTIYRNLKQSRETVEKVWPLILMVCENKNIPEQIVDGIVYLGKNLTEDINNGRAKKKILSIGYELILKACQEASAYYAKGGARVWASGILKVMNKGMQNKFELKNGLD